jgi:nucleoside-diphosphate-sugar epimerase
LETVLVTGASGFVGSALCPHLRKRGFVVREANRLSASARRDEFALDRGLDGDTDWSGALAGVDLVVHLAARVHVMRESAHDPLGEFRRTNVAGTERLAHAAAAAGVRRLVYLSSVKVHGDRSFAAPLSEDDLPAPEDAYGISKWEAENVLHRVAQETGIEVTILRPPLVYGPGVKANFRRIMGLAASGLPLPFASTENRRSLIFVGNLADAITRCLDHPAAAGETFLVSDGMDLSTPALVAGLRHALGMPSRLFRCPPALLGAVATLAHKEAEASRLLDSLRVDITKISTLLSWQPAFTVEQGIRMTCQDYLAARGGMRKAAQ